jgi:uncharacterized protein (UPF0333 family)
MSTNPISKSTVALTALVLTGLGACLGLGFGLRTQIKSSLSETNQTTMNSVFIAESVTLTILLLLAGGILSGKGINLKMSFYLIIPVLSSVLLGISWGYYQFISDNRSTYSSALVCLAIITILSIILSNSLSKSSGGGGEVGNNSSKSGVVVLFGIIGILFLISGALFASARSDIEQNPSVGSDAQNGYRLLYILSIIGGVVGILGVILYFYRKNKKSAEMTSQ